MGRNKAKRKRFMAGKSPAESADSRLFRTLRLAMRSFYANRKRNFFLTISLSVSILMFLAVAWFLDFQYATREAGNQRVQTNYIAVQCSTPEAADQLTEGIRLLQGSGEARGEHLNVLQVQHAVMGGALEGKGQYVNLDWNLLLAEKMPEGILLYSGLDQLGNTDDPSNERNYESFQLIAGSNVFRGPKDIVISAFYAELLGKRPEELIGETIVLGFEDSSSAYHITGVMKPLRTERRMNREAIQKLQKVILTEDANRSGEEQECSLVLNAIVADAAVPAKALTGWDAYLFFRDQDTCQACASTVKALDQEAGIRDQYLYYTPEQTEMESRSDRTAVLRMKAVLLLIVTIFSGISVFGTMQNAIADRKKEIGIRKALGAGDGDIMLGFVLENGLNAMASILIAVSLCSTVFILFACYQRQILLIDYRIRFYPLTGFLFVCYAFSNVLGFSLIPAYHAAQMNAVDALREE